MMKKKDEKSCNRTVNPLKREREIVNNWEKSDEDTNKKDENKNQVQNASIKIQIILRSY